MHRRRLGSIRPITTNIMTDTIKHWNKAAWDVTEKLPGEIGAEWREQWNAFAAENRMVVTFFGPYDSGKSTLLKRLLVDDGRRVPDWLTISARRETFEQNSVEALNLLIRDTPGIAGGNELHEAVTDDALLYTDVVVVILPPQLITGERKAITSVLDGSRFHSESSVAFPPGGLLIALSRMDEAGAMPTINLSGYLDLVTRKRHELSGLLATANVDESRISFHALIADSSGMVGNRQISGPHEYDAERAWDGMTEFAGCLRSLTDRLPELRAWSERRFLCYHLGKISQALQETAAQTKLAHAAIENETEAYHLQTQRIQAFLGAARADLNHRVSEEVASACRRGDSNHGAVLEILNERITATLDRWWDAQNAALQTIANEIDAEVQQRSARPDWQNMFNDFKDETMPFSGTTPDDESKRFKYDDILRLNKTLQKAYREAVPVMLDIPLDKVREELQRLAQVGSFQEYAKQAAHRTGTLRDSDHVNKARNALLLDTGFAVAVPAIMEIASMVSDLQSDAKAAEDRITRRTEQQAKIDGAARGLADKTWSIWHTEGLPAALEAALVFAKNNAVLRSKAIMLQQELVMEIQNQVTAIMARSK